MDVNLEMNVPTEKPFSFLREKSLSLQMLAGSKYALFVRRNLYYDPTRNDGLSWFSLLKESPESIREMNKVPPLLKAFINELILRIGEEIRMWEVNFRAALVNVTVPNLHNVSHEHIVDILVKGFDNIACNPDGSICFQSSARNLLMKEHLDPMVRFRIACAFCLEDQVRDIWPSVKEIPGNDLPDDDIFESDKPRLMMYWKYILNGIPVEESFVKKVLYDMARDGNWAAFEYLLDKVREARQIKASVRFIQRQDFYSMKRVLLKLNRRQIRDVCQEVGDLIFYNIVTHEKYHEHAMDVWTYVKNNIALSVFVKTVRQLWRLVFNPSGSEITRVKYNSALLLEVWSSASALRKRRVDREKLFERLDCVVRGVHQYDLKFMFELLTETRLEIRKKIWWDNWRKLIIRTIPSELKRLMELFFDNCDEIEKFKENHEESIEKLLVGDYFSELVNRGLYSELNDCLSFFVKNPRRLEELSEEIIMSNLDRIASCDENEFTECHQFIRNTFRDAEKADKFTKGIISSPECLGWIYCKLDECCFDKVENLCRRFPSSKVALEEMKREFLVYCHRNFTRGQISGFRGQRFAEFVSWCSPGEKESLEFKDSLFVDDIFEIVVNDFILEATNNLRQATQRILSSFDSFLQWYFGSLEAARRYKSIKLCNCDEWKGVKDVLLKAPPYCVRELLYWGFENDQDKVETVMLRLSRC